MTRNYASFRFISRTYRRFLAFPLFHSSSHFALPFARIGLINSDDISEGGNLNAGRGVEVVKNDDS